MANRKHLINVHTSTGTQAPTGASLYLGEIAVQHTPNEPAIWIKMGSAETSTDYEKFIGETEIINMLEETKILGSGYTYSGLSYIDSSTTIADAFSALTNELIKDEKVTAAAINELNVKTNEINSIKQIIREDEEVTAGAINLLNERVAGVETHMTGDYIQITGYELASGSTEEELTLREEDTVDEAFGKLQKQMLDNEEAIAAGLNDLNNKVDDLEEQIEHSTGVTQLSGAVMTLCAATVAGFDEMFQYVQEGLNEKADYTELEALSAGTVHDIAAVSAKTAGILTLNLNGVEQGQYCPSASTEINLEAIQEITGADVLLTGYELATGSTEEELVVLASDTVNEAFGKLQKQNYDNEAVVAGALNDLDERIAALEEGGSVEPLSAATVALSAATVEVESGLTILSGVVMDTSYVVAMSLNDLNRKVDALSGNTGLSELSAATVGIESGLGALSGGVISLSSVTETLSGVTEENSDNIETLSGVVIDNELVTAEALISLNNKIAELSGNTGISELSAATINVESGLTILSGAVMDMSYVVAMSLNDLSSKENALSAGTVAAVADLEDKIDELSGNSGFDGFEEITWSALKTLRDSSGLTPGKQYRITDYNTTTSQENTQAAGHQFDIIVVADSVNKLNENARAALHDGDTYFSTSGANLNAWEIKYSLDNDASRFLWANTGATGRGVIYYMKDEWNNECPYDFKNIQFPRYEITACPNSPSLVGQYSVNGANGITVDTATTYWCYTFTWINANDEIEDLSIVGQTLPTGDGQYIGVFDNKIESFSSYGLYPDSPSSFTFALSNNCFISTYGYEDGIFYGCYANRLRNDCDRNTLGNNSYYNTFGNNSYYNTFGDDCQRNTFGNNCYYNTFGNYCQCNTFRSYCQRNTFGNSCSYNTFGDNCGQNTFGNSCSDNTFGNSCSYNTFGNSCQHNTFGNSCQHNTFGNSCSDNTFGNSCQHNTFGNNCQSNTFGEYVKYFITGNATGATTSAQTKNYIRYLIVENGVQNVNAYCTGTTSSSNNCQNIKIGLGLKGTSSGNRLQIDITQQIGATASVTYQPASSQVINI